MNPGVLNHTSERNVTHYKLGPDQQFQLDTSFRQKPFVKNYNRFPTLMKSSVLFLAYRAKNQVPRTGEIMLEKFYPGPATEEEEEQAVDSDTLSLIDRAILKRLSEDERVVFVLNLPPGLRNIVTPLIHRSQIIDLWPPLFRMQKGGFDPYHWPIPDKRGHWNIPAHQLIGKEIAESMKFIIKKDNF